MDEHDGVRQKLGQQLEARRRALGKTRQDVEREGSIASGSMSRFESGERLPAAETLIALTRPLVCVFLVTKYGIVLNEEGL